MQEAVGGDHSQSASGTLCQAAIAAPPLRGAHMGLARPHDMGTQVIRQVLNESQKVWLAHARARADLTKARVGLRGMMAWVEAQICSGWAALSSPAQPCATRGKAAPLPPRGSCWSGAYSAHFPQQRPWDRIIGGVQLLDSCRE